MTELGDISSCVVCGAPVRPILDLGRQAVANDLIERADEPYAVHPLGFAVCPSCSHGQLTFFLDPADIYASYVYASGTSRTLRQYFSWFAAGVAGSLGPDVDVLELASNDGSLLDAFRDVGIAARGIDPAESVCAEAEAKGHDVQCGFFPATRPHDPVDVVVAMNVLAHGPDPRSFMQGIAECLRPGGLALIQTSQANMIDNGEFDTIYHEHYSFFSARSMATLARSVGLELERIDLVSVHGTSFVFTVRRPGETVGHVDFGFADDPGSFLVPVPNPTPTMMDPDCSDDEARRAYDAFSDTARLRMADTAELLTRRVESGKSIGLLGVAAKALTFVRAAGIEPSAYFDEARLKIGRYVPGAASPIRALGDLADLDDDIVLLVGAWNFADELSAKVADVIEGTPMEGRVELVAHLPSLRTL